MSLLSHCKKTRRRWADEAFHLLESTPCHDVRYMWWHHSRWICPHPWSCYLRNGDIYRPNYRENRVICVKNTQNIWSLCFHWLTLRKNNTRWIRKHIHTTTQGRLWLPIDSIPSLAFDHGKILAMALEKINKGSVEDWKGENLLGCALMETRGWLREK